ncbi:hypothetical protein KKC91_10115 [bacterium]|nr:hypothetical protein [bacterium]
MDNIHTAANFIELESRINKFRLFWKCIRLFEGITIFLFSILISIIAVLGLDSLIHFSPSMRLVCLIAFWTGAITCFVAFIIKPMIKYFNIDQVAVHIEKAYPYINNRLINAIQLGRKLDSHTAVFTDALITDSLKTTQMLSLKKAVNKRKLCVFAYLLAGSVLLTTLYFAAFPRYFKNSYARLIHPLKDIPPITLTTLNIMPGNCTVFTGDDVIIITSIKGVMPYGAEIIYKYENERKYSHTQMNFKNDSFLYELKNITQPVKYRIIAGDGKSALYRIEVKERPQVKKVKLTYKYPGYTNLPIKTVESANGHIEALIGTRVDTQFHFNKPLKTLEVKLDKKRISFSMIKPEIAQGEIPVLNDGIYTVYYTDMHGCRNLTPDKYRIKTIEDISPLVEITSPAKNLQLSKKDSISITSKSVDDYGIKTIILKCTKDATVYPSDIRNYDIPKKEILSSFKIDLNKMDIKTGDILTYYVEAVDNTLPTVHRAISKKYNIEIVDKKQNLDKDKKINDIIAKLKEIISEQIENKKSVTILNSEEHNNPNIDKTLGKQVDIRAKTIEIISSIDETHPVYKYKDRLDYTSAVLMVKAIKGLDSAKNSTSPAKFKLYLHETELTQEEIILVLKGILYRIEQLSQNQETVIAEKPEEDTEKAHPVLKKLDENLSKFLEDQQEIIKQTSELAKIGSEGLSEQEKEQLKKLSMLESEWGKIFKKAADDLSRLPDVDFPASTLIEQTNQLFSDVEKIADNLVPNTIEIAVPIEDAGLLLAKQLKQDLEIWLPDKPDRVKWNMEQPIGDYEVPMADLPDELEDMIGELIEQEEDLIDEAQNITSAWADSMGEAGWEVQDGPISNFSAKGKTGNVLPDSSEITGRSGEGRSGKTSGELVQSKVMGLGGRKTPARLTSDPFQKGIIPEEKATETGGATGGGKISGAGGEGLPGTPPPEVELKLRMLHDKQLQVLSRAKNIAKGLDRLNYPSDILNESINSMHDVCENIKNYQAQRLLRTQQIILTKLKDAQTSVVYISKARRDRSIGMPKDLRKKLTTVKDEEYIPKYNKLLKAYYEKLSNPDM